jgi:hypothetical protein
MFLLDFCYLLDLTGMLKIRASNIMFQHKIERQIKFIEEYYFADVVIKVAIRLI